MTDPCDPKYWDEHPDVFVRDLGLRLGLVEPIRCGVIYDKVVALINELGMTRQARRQEADARNEERSRLLLVLRDAFHGWKDSWDLCDDNNLDHDDWTTILEAVRRGGRDD